MEAEKVLGALSRPVRKD